MVKQKCSWVPFVKLEQTVGTFSCNLHLAVYSYFGAWRNKFSLPRHVLMVFATVLLMLLILELSYI